MAAALHHPPARVGRTSGGGIRRGTVARDPLSATQGVASLGGILAPVGKGLGKPPHPDPGPNAA